MTQLMTQRIQDMLSQQQDEQFGADGYVGSRHRLSVVARGANGQPRTYRLAPSSVQHTAYRRLALTILGLDVPTLADELRSTRRSALAHIASSATTTARVVRLSAMASEPKSARRNPLRMLQKETPATRMQLP
jgi:hypothetical protein